MKNQGKHYWWKVFAYAALFGVVLFVGSTSLVHAQYEGLAGLAGSAGATAAQSGATTWKGAVTAVVGSAFDNIGYYIIGKIAFGVSYMIAWIAGILVAIEAWVVGVILGLNTGVFSAAVVQKGFAATLSIANLGFVLGIIIIAVATILHRETYGYKKILWKLVAAAILVNFSLVIAAPIFNLGNSFTTYFLNCVDPGGGGCNGQGAGIGLPAGHNSMNDFATNLAAAFNPQVGLINATGTNFDTVNSSVSLGQSFGKMLIPILSIGFVAAELVAIVIVLGALIAMLIVRYVYIAILLVLMPFAWLGWVFPVIKDWWSKWWNQFIRWTFFPAIVVFFLWLAMITAQSMRNGTAIANQQFGTYTSNSNPYFAPIANFIGNAFNPIIAQVLNTLVLLGLSIGGLIVADRMSLAGSKAIIGTAKSAANGVQGYVGKKTRRVVGDRVRNAGRQYNPATRETTTGLQRFGSRLQNVPGLRGAGAALAQATAPATIKHDREKDIQEHVDTQLKSLANDGIVARATSRGAFTDPVKAAAVAQELARRNLTTDPAIVPLMDRYVATADMMGNLEKVTANRPDLMPMRPGETRDQATARAIAGAKGDIVNVDAQIFNVNNLATAQGRLGLHMNIPLMERATLALNPAQLAAIGSDTSPSNVDRKINITDAVKQIAMPYRTATPNAAGKYELDTSATGALARDMLTRPELRSLQGLVKRMDLDSNWDSVFN